jgi:hypothetical protein
MQLSVVERFVIEMWKEAFVAYLRYYPNVCMKGLRRCMVGTLGYGD